MPANSPRVRQRLRTSRRRIVRYWLSRIFGVRLQKSQLVYFVDVGDARYKRILLRDSQLARAIQENLERFGESDRFPRLVTTYEHELWVEFVTGEPLVRIDESAVRAIAEFYAEVYARGVRRVAVDETPFPGRLRADLRFLREVGVLDESTHEGLSRAAERLAPEQVWVGFDYTDAVLKNFVRRPETGRVCAVDVESLECDQLIGFGLGKAFVRWLEPERKFFLECLAAADAPDLGDSLEYAELCFLAFWTKMGFLEQKWRYVSSAHFDRFLKAQ